MGERWIIWFVCLADISELENVECKNHLLLRLSFSFSQPFFLRVQVTAWSLKKTPALQAFGLTNRVCLFLRHGENGERSILIPASWFQRCVPKSKCGYQDYFTIWKISMASVKRHGPQNKSRDICRENSCLEKIQAKNKLKTFRARLSS